MFESIFMFQNLELKKRKLLLQKPRFNVIFSKKKFNVLFSSINDSG